MDIVNVFYYLAEKHEALKAFEYIPPYEKGAGTKPTPYLSLEDPYYISLPDKLNRATYQVNFLVLFDANTPVSQAQNEGILIALEIIENSKRLDGIIIPENVSMVTVSDYSDAKEAGVRVSYSFVTNNPVALCDTRGIPSKVFDEINALPVFSVANPDGCAVFGENLPEITL